MSEKTLKFSNIKVNKKEFHKSKQAIKTIKSFDLQFRYICISFDLLFI